MKKAKKSKPKKKLPKKAESLRSQLDRLANVILHEIRPQPVKGENKIDTAIRLLRAQAKPETVHVALTPREARQTVFALLRMAERIDPTSYAENSTSDFIKALAKKVDVALMMVEDKGQNLMTPLALAK